MRTKIIKQEDEFGCGIACVAVLLNISYQQALRLFGSNSSKVTYRGFFCSDICMVLSKYDKNHSYKYVKDRLRKKIYKPNTIVFIKKSKKYPAGHYLLRTKEGWFDPWINLTKNNNIKDAQSGIRKRLPGKAIYYIYC